MAKSDVIKSDDLFDENLFAKTTEDAKKLLVELDKLNEGLKAIQKTAASSTKGNKLVSAKDIDEATKALEKMAQARKTQGEVEKQQKKVKEQLTIQQKAEIAALKQIEKQELALATAEAKLLLARQGRLGLEARLNAENAKLRVERAKLTGLEQDYEAQVKRINEQLDANNELIRKNSDKQKQQTLNIGNYTDSVREAIDSSEAYKRVLGGMDSSASQFASGLNILKKKLVEIKTSFKEANSTKDKFKIGGAGLIGLAGLVGGAAIGATLSQSRKAANEFEIKMGQLGNTAKAVLTAISNLVENKLAPTFENVILKVQNFFGSVENLDEKIAANEAKINSYKSGFDNLGDTIEKTNELVRQQIELQQELIDTTNLYQVQIGKLNAQAEVYNTIAGDSTRSFEELRAANFAELETTRKRVALEVELAKARKESAILETQRAFKLNNKDVTRQQIESLSFIKDENLQKTIGIELQQKLTDSIVDFNEKQSQYTIAQARIDKEVRQVKQDEVEKNLDIIIDGFDVQKTVNEKIIADQKRTFTERRKVLEETKRLADKAFADEEAQLQRLTKEKLDAQKLVETSDSKTLNENIRKLKASEIAEQRTLEVVKERRIAVQDLADAQRDLNQQEAEKNARIKESQKANEVLREEIKLRQMQREFRIEEQIQGDADVFNANKLLEMQAKQVEQKKLLLGIERDYQAEIIDRTIVEEDEKLQKLKELNEKYIDDLKQLDEERADNAARLKKQQFDSEVNYANKTFQSISSEFASELSKKRQLQDENNNLELQLAQEQVEKQQQLADKGIANSLVNSQKRAKEIELANRDARERASREQEAIQLVQAYFNALNARLTQYGSDPNTAPARALADVLLAKGIAKGLVQFAADGNNMIEGEGTTTSDSIPFMLSKKEAVIKASENIKHNDAVVALNAGRFDLEFMRRSEFERVKNSAKYSDQALMVNAILESNAELKSLLVDIKNKPVQMVDVDGMNRLVETIHGEGMTRIVTHTRKPKTQRL